MKNYSVLYICKLQILLSAIQHQELQDNREGVRINVNIQIMIVLTLNFLISIIGTLAYSVRLVGVRTGKIAITYSVFSILTLISRTAGSFQMPLLTKFVENNQGAGIFASILLLLPASYLIVFIAKVI